jgi:opacity protein-like surface antigen
MRLSRLLLAASAAILLASAAEAAAPAAANPPAMGGAMHGGGGAMRGMFTQEERMVMFSDGLKATAGMTDDQQKAYRQDRRTKIMAMSDADRAKFKADLDARWAAMPADQKASLTAKVQAFMASRHPGPSAQ